MRYLVQARVKPGCEKTLLEAVERGKLGQGSVAGGEYIRNMREARELPGEEVRWVEICYCPMPRGKALLGRVLRRGQSAGRA